MRACCITYAFVVINSDPLLIDKDGEEEEEEEEEAEALPPKEKKKKRKKEKKKDFLGTLHKWLQQLL